MDESSQAESKNIAAPDEIASDETAEEPQEKLTPLQLIRQKQAAQQQHRTGGGKGGKAKAAGQGGAAASRKPTTGRQSYGGNS